MARAYKCDRCGNYYDFYGEEENIESDIFVGRHIRINSLGVQHGTIVGNFSEVAADICPSCKESFLKWWNRWQEGNYNSHNEERE